MHPIRRKSLQREKIYEIIKKSRLHPTAQLVYDTLRKNDPSVSLGNVYRNIRILIEEGRIVCREFGDGIEHYDAVIKIHYHFICNNCGEVRDFDMPIQDALTEQAQKISKHAIAGHTIQFFGICETCRKSGKSIKKTDIPKNDRSR